MSDVIKNAFNLTSINAIPMIKYNKRLYSVIESKIEGSFKITCADVTGKKAKIAWEIEFTKDGKFHSQLNVESEIIEHLLGFYLSRETDGIYTLNSWASWVNSNLASVHSLVVLVMFRDRVTVDLATDNAESRSTMQKLTLDDIALSYATASKMLDRGIVERKFPLAIKNKIAMLEASKDDIKALKAYAEISDYRQHNDDCIQYKLPPSVARAITVTQPTVKVVKKTTVKKVSTKKASTKKAATKKTTVDKTPTVINITPIVESTPTDNVNVIAS